MFKPKPADAPIFKILNPPTLPHKEDIFVLLVGVVSLLAGPFKWADPGLTGGGF